MAFTRISAHESSDRGSSMRRLLTAARLIAALIVCLPRSTAAQPWVPPAGTGAVTVGLQRIDHTGHRVTDGTLFSNGKSLNVSLYIGAEYALTDRWSLSATLPYVFGKYSDPAPPPPFVPFLPIDQCRCWNSDFQDFDVTARYSVAIGSVALTPSLSATLPVQDYAYRGEAAVGRHLRELRVGVDAGLRLDAFHPRLSLDGRYALALVERVLDIPNNRSNGAVGVAYRIRPNLSARAVVGWQRTHGGLRIGSPPPSDLLPPGEVNTRERVDEHDRLLRDNSTHVGGTVSYQFTRVDVFATYLAFVSGSDTHAGRAITTGISWPFELRR